MSLIRWVVCKGGTPDSWLGRLVGRKPRMVAAVALANKMARTIWRKRLLSNDSNGARLGAPGGDRLTTYAAKNSKFRIWRISPGAQARSSLN